MERTQKDTAVGVLKSELARAASLVLAGAVQAQQLRVPNNRLRQAVLELLRDAEAH